jgi:cell division protein FtsZ
MAHPDVNLISGAVIDETMADTIRITVIATGFDHNMPLMRQIARPENRSLPSRQPVREPATVSAAPRQAPRSQPSNETPFRVNDLDIPAFLRKRK